jgi:hypothetical protein
LSTARAAQMLEQKGEPKSSLFAICSAAEFASAVPSRLVLFGAIELCCFFFFELIHE